MVLDDGMHNLVVVHWHAPWIPGSEEVLREIEECATTGCLPENGLDGNASLNFGLTLCEVITLTYMRFRLDAGDGLQ